MKTGPRQRVASRLVFSLVAAAALQAQNADSFADDAHPSKITDSPKATSAENATKVTPSMQPVLADGYLQKPLAYNQVRPAGILADRIQL
ncbi:MAG: hypothetical protein SGJ20_21815, partial [Planctomycetota bacterium]|nr:hypothetical protein [Planctomycetota bacterium]